MEGSSSLNSDIWFSHLENKYDAELKLFQGKSFRWTKRPQMWDWDNCDVSWVRMSESELRVVIRSYKTVYSDYRKKEIKVKYMLGFDTNLEGIEYPKLEQYKEPLKNIDEKRYGRQKQRLVLRISIDYYIWQWMEDKTDQTFEQTEVYRIYENILKSLKEPIISSNRNIFLVEDIPKDDRIIPVIYQVAIDSWKNFVREVHCHKLDEHEYEVTILFENEQLRKHGKLNIFYRIFRYLRYGRVADIESFKIMLDKGKPVKLQFRGIFSGEHGIEEDDIHGDKPENQKVRTHDIKYYFNDERHPIIFINTSNHAMSFHDTNHKLWKWEYIPWEKDGPVIYGQNTRKQVERFR